MTDLPTDCTDLQVMRARLGRDQVDAQAAVLTSQAHLHQALRQRSRDDRRALRLDADSVDALNAADLAYEELLRVTGQLAEVNGALRRHLDDLDTARRQRLNGHGGPVGGQHDGGVGGRH